MQLILPLVVFIWSLPPAHSHRKKREDRVPWQTVVELQRIFREGNKRALDIETFTKQAAIRQNEQNALLASSGTVLSPMAAMAAATNRFSPPALTFALRRDGNHDLSNGVTPTTFPPDHDLRTFERQILLANGLSPTMLLRDVPPPVPPPAQPTALILPLPFEPRIPSTGIGVVETPLVVDQPLNELRQPPRPKLPSRHEDSGDDSFRMF